MPLDINAARAAKAAKNPAATSGAPTGNARSAKADPGAVPETRTSAKLSEIAPNPLNPRSEINPDSEAMIQLRQSMLERGQIQPVAVVTADHFRRIFQGTEHVGKVGGAAFVIIGGGRRYAAAMANRSVTLKITVLHGSEAPQTPGEWLVVTVAENVQRDKLSVMQTARAVRDLREHLSGRDVATELRKTPAWVSLYNGLNELPGNVQTIIESAPFSLRQARRVYAQENPAAQLHEAQKIWEELMGFEKPEEETAPQDPTTAHEPNNDLSPAPTQRAVSKGGRKAFTPAQRLHVSMDKLDRTTIIDALRLRFPHVDPTLIEAALSGPENEDVVVGP